MIVGLGDIYAQIPRREEVRELMRATQASVREQPGCISYSFAETLDDPGHFVVVQRWRDQAAVDEHYGSRAFADYQAKIGDLLVRNSELSLHVVEEGFRPVSSSAVSSAQED
ncbi:MAG: antibiotic biosynthesis monooxygenase [Actinobacteria bacterium]|nr:MAG: antibiotic biosynthesis monooxygenase [Actinomycetota bacterium]